jgi:hypothetical protein
MDETVSNVTLGGLEGLVVGIMTFCIGNGGAPSFQLREVGQVPLFASHMTFSGMFNTANAVDDPVVVPPEPVPETVVMGVVPPFDRSDARPVGVPGSVELPTLPVDCGPASACCHCRIKGSCCPCK